MSSFVRMALDKLKNRQNLVSLVDELRRRKHKTGSLRTYSVTNILDGGGGGLDGYDPNAVVITDADGAITTDPSLEYVEGSSTTYTPGSQISTGTVAGNASAGATISGLTIGNWYAIEGTGGPFGAAPGNQFLSYNFTLSNDGGSTWDGAFGLTASAGFKLDLASWTAFAEAVDSHHARVYFQATTTSVKMRCNDTLSSFADNTGSLGYKLLNATYAVGSEKMVTLDDVEYTAAKLAGATHNATLKTPISTDEVPIWNSATGTLGKATVDSLGGGGGTTTTIGDATEFSTSNVSNPPTEAELITAFGSPDTNAAKIVHLLDDNNLQTSAYMAAALGGHWFLFPLTKAVQATSSVTVDSTATLVTGSVGGLDWHGRAYVRRRADGVLVMIYRSATGHNTNDAVLHIRFSDDYGATWTADDTTLSGDAVTGFPMTPPVGNISYGEGNLHIFESGRIVVHMWSVTGVSPTGTLNGTYQSVSDDDGETWTTPAAVTIIDNPSADTDTFITDDDFSFGGVMYAGARIYYDTDGVPSANILVKSEDNGDTWTYISTIQGQAEGGTGGQEVGIEYLGNNTIIAMLRDNPHTNSYQRMSTDMGATWGTLTDVTATVGIAGRQRVYTRSHLKGYDNWWQDRVLIMVGFVHQVSGSSQSRRNCVWVSLDAGTTWSAPQYIDSTTEDAGYGDIFWNPNTSQYVVINYQGTLSAASLKQYNLTIGGL